MADASPAKHTGMDQQYSPVVVVGVLGILLLFLWPVIALLVPAAIVGGLLVFIFKRINASTSEDSNEVVKDLKESAVQMKEVPQPRNADDAHAPPPVATAERIETTQVRKLTCIIVYETSVHLLLIIPYVRYFQFYMHNSNVLKLQYTGCCSPE